MKLCRRHVPPCADQFDLWVIAATFLVLGACIVALGLRVEDLREQVEVLRASAL